MLLGPSDLVPDYLFDTDNDFAIAKRPLGQARPVWTPAPLDTVRARLAALRRAGVWTSSTYAIIAQMVLPLLVRDSATRRPLATAIAQALPLLQDAGILLLGADVSSPGKDQYWLNERKQLVAAGLTPYQVLAMGTRHVAAYFGALDERGTIEVASRPTWCCSAAIRYRTSTTRWSRRWASCSEGTGSCPRP